MVLGKRLFGECRLCFLKNNDIYKQCAIKILARYGKRGIAKAVLDGINKASKNVIILVMGENSQDPRNSENGK